MEIDIFELIEKTCYLRRIADTRKIGYRAALEIFKIYPKQNKIIEALNNNTFVCRNIGKNKIEALKKEFITRG